MHDFGLVDDTVCAGRLEATSQGREACWRNWCAFQTQVQCLTGFAARTQTGYYGQGGQVQSSTVTGAITAIGQSIALACNSNPTKVMGSEKFILALQVMIDGYIKQNLANQEDASSVKADFPKLLLEMGYSKSGTPHTQAVGDLALIIFIICSASGNTQ